MKLFKSLLKKKNETSFPKEVNSWEKVAKYHRDLAKKHATLSHEYGEEGNYEAEDLHDKAAKAHRLAHEALHYPDDKKGYDELSKKAENASKKANFFVKESLDESNISNYHLTQYRKHANIAVKEYDNDRDLSDLHLKAANAHKLAYSAYNRLDDGDKKGDYSSFSKYADLASKAANASSKDNSSIKESLDESNESLDIASVFKNIASKYKNKQTKSTESRSAPDTGKFIATHYGHIEYLPNVQTYRGHGDMFVDNHKHFIQVGSNVDHETRKNIYKDVHNTLKDHGYKSVDYKGNETDDLDNVDKDWIKLKDENGNKHILSKVSGSAWGGIGLRHDK